MKTVYAVPMDDRHYLIAQALRLAAETWAEEAARARAAELPTMAQEADDWSRRASTYADALEAGDLRAADVTEVAEWA